MSIRTLSCSSCKNDLYHPIAVRVIALYEIVSIFIKNKPFLGLFVRICHFCNCHISIFFLEVFSFFNFYIFVLSFLVKAEILVTGDLFHNETFVYSKTCLKQLLSKRPKIEFQGPLSLNAGQKHCRMLQGEHSTILLTFIKLPFVIKMFVLSIFEWLFKTGFTVYAFTSLFC